MPQYCVWPEPPGYYRRLEFTFKFWTIILKHCCK
jgi:hypothetical protein